MLRSNRVFASLVANKPQISTSSQPWMAGVPGIHRLGLSCITNMAAGILPRKLSHEEVLDTANRASGKLQSLLRAVIPAIAG